MSPKNTGRQSTSAIYENQRGAFAEAKRAGVAFKGYVPKRRTRALFKNLAILVASTLICSVIALVLGEVLLGWMGTS